MERPNPAPIHRLLRRVLVEYEDEPVLGWGSDPGLFKREERSTRVAVLQDYIDIQLVTIGGELGARVTYEIRPRDVDAVTIEETGGR